MTTWQRRGGRQGVGRYGSYTRSEEIDSLLCPAKSDRYVYRTVQEHGKIDGEKLG